MKFRKVVITNSSYTKLDFIFKLHFESYHESIHICSVHEDGM